jgi:hypothetical protein
MYLIFTKKIQIYPLKAKKLARNETTFFYNLIFLNPGAEFLIKFWTRVVNIK